VLHRVAVDGPFHFAFRPCEHFRNFSDTETGKVSLGGEGAARRESATSMTLFQLELKPDFQGWPSLLVSTTAEPSVRAARALEVKPDPGFANT
jgi:hypothetical protein